MNFYELRPLFTFIIHMVRISQLLTFSNMIDNHRTKVLLRLSQRIQSFDDEHQFIAIQKSSFQNTESIVVFEFNEFVKMKIRYK